MRSEPLKRPSMETGMAGTVDKNDRNGMAQLFHRFLATSSRLVVRTPDGDAIARVAGVSHMSCPAIRARRLWSLVERPQGRVLRNASRPSYRP
jgi:hypothetical protein